MASVDNKTSAAKHFVDARWVEGAPDQTKTDNFRKSTGQIWKTDPNTGEMVFTPISKLPYTIEYNKTTYDENATFMAQTQILTLKGPRVENPSVDFFPDMWEQQIEDVFFHTLDFRYADHSFEADVLHTEKELEHASGVRFSPPFIKASAEYNFYIQGYERLIANRWVDERTLPNLYAFASEKRNTDIDTELIDASGARAAPTNPDYFDLITLGGTLPDNAVRPEMIIREGREGVEAIGKRTSQQQYFDLWASKYSSVNLEVLSRIQNKYSNIIFSQDNFSLMRDHNNEFKYFPMGVRLEFSSDKNSAFSEILRESKLFDSFMMDAADFFKSQEASRNELEFVDVSNPQESPGPAIDSENPPIERRFFPTMDITDWWESLQTFFGAQATVVEQEPIGDFGTLGRQTVSGESSSEDNVFMGTLNPLLIGRDPEKDFMKSLLLLIFSGRVRKLIRDKMRTYEEASAGKKSYSEIVFYKISKFIVEEGVARPDPDQNFYLPNSKEQEIIEFIDTQVKYGGTQGYNYKYVVKAYNIVIGTKWRYEEPEFPSPLLQPDATVTVHSRPSLKIIETPLYEREISVLDDAPIPPNVNLIPFRGISNRLKINLQGNVGEYEADPILITASDFEWIRDFRKKRDLEPDDLIPYKSDDHAGYFEIYRTTTAPISYRSFASSLLVDRITTDISKETIQAATAASFEDKTIKSNTKYYYMFRVIDIHGNISNPSPVYEVELTDDHGAVIPIIQIFEFNPDFNRAPSKPMKKYIKIEPKLEHTFLDVESSELPDFADEVLEDYRVEKVKLGKKEESIWKKTFKVRFTSRSTGKKFDLNLTFGTKPIKKGNF